MDHFGTKPKGLLGLPGTNKPATPPNPAVENVVEKTDQARTEHQTVRDLESTTGAGSAESNEQRLEMSNALSLLKPGEETKLKGTYQGFSSDKTAEELGVDPPEEKQPYEQALAEDSASRMGSQDSEELYSCHPIQNLRIGPFVFEGTVLRVKGKTAAAFADALDQLPLSERNNIRKIDAGRVDEIVKARAQATQNFDSSVGRSAMEQLRGEFPVVGKEDVRTAHMNMPGTDNNLEVPIPAIVESDRPGDTADKGDPAK